ncbi:hypothetical protein GQ54DRAFT_314396 [Martensiomyces pterosporus]|nr:hypothetical protein GQ54DRAFT_314396 [Martensiomyces pterosporus]
MEHLVVDSRMSVINPAALVEFLRSREIAGTALPGIKCLTIRHFLERSRSGYISDRQNLSLVVDYFLKEFAGLQSVKYVSSGTDVIFNQHPVDQLFQQLPELAHIFSVSPIPPNLTSIARAIQSLVIKKPIVNDVELQPFSIQISQSLAHLKLVGYSLHELMSVLAASRDSSNTAFPSLQHLAIHFHERAGDEWAMEPSGQQNKMLTLPQLCDIQFWNCAHDHARFLDSVNCPSLRYIHTEDVECAYRFGNASYPRLMYLSMSGSEYREIDNTEMARCAESILSKFGSLKVLCLSADLELPASVTRLACACDRLQRLEIGFKMVPASVACILSQLPSLLHLVIAWYEDGYEETNQREAFPVAPLIGELPISTSVETITVPRTFGCLEYVPFTQFSQLVSQIPSLKEIISPPPTAMAIELALLRYSYSLEKSHVFGVPTISKMQG